MIKSRQGRQTREEIAHLILSDILAGRWAPGARLPGHTRLRPEFGPTVSNTTLNAAIGILKELGFLRVRRQHSTCVADPLPYRNRYLIAFPREPDPSHPSTLYSVLYRIALDRQRRGGDIEYAVINGSGVPGQREAMRERLADEARWHRIGGVLFAGPILDAAAEPLLTEPGIARVSLVDPIPGIDMPPMPHGGIGTPPSHSFPERGAAWLRAQGHRTVAVIGFGFGYLQPKHGLWRWRSVGAGSPGARLWPRRGCGPGPSGC